MLVLHVAPHPDDELIGAPATLMALRDAGHEIVNVACSLGNEAGRLRRHSELLEACRRAGFEPVVLEQPLTDEHHSDAAAVRADSERRVAAELEGLLATRPFELVVGPSPHDRHPGHELVARAIRTAVETGEGPARWWMWGIWGDLPLPTTVVRFDRQRLREICFALSAHKGELDRNDYRRLVAGRARAAVVLAPELTFHFGAAGLEGPFAETTSEVVYESRCWQLGLRRELDPQNPLPPPAGPDVGWWLHAASVTDRLRAVQPPS